MTATAGLRARGVVVVIRARSDRTGGFADGLGESDQVVGGGGWGCEVAVVADELPASGGGEAACVRLAQVVGVRLGEGGEGTHYGRGIAVDVGQRGDRLSGTAVPGATPW
jgi:hypothetical protein